MNRIFSLLSVRASVPSIIATANRRARAKTHSSLGQRIDIAVTDRPEGIREFWAKLEKQGTATVYQRYDWVKTSLETLEKDERRSAFIVTGTLDGEPAFLLPLSINRGVMRELTWVGGSHANFNMGLFSRAFLERFRPGDICALMQRILRLVPGIGYIKLCCQPFEWHGVANPFAALTHQRSMNQAFAMDLADSFEAQLNAGNAKRKRKKFRQQTRMAEEAGGYRMLVPTERGEIGRVLEAFFRQKSARLREKGIADVFGNEQARRFILRLATEPAAGDEPLLHLFALEVGGQIRAVFGGGVHNNHLSGYFSSISSDEFTQWSPGEMLLYLVVERCIADGLTGIDLGGGDERYKRSWCDRDIEMFDVILPINPAALPLALVMRRTNQLKRYIRERPQLWSLVGAARRVRSHLLGPND